MEFSVHTGERFFTDFDIEILRSVKAASRRTTEAPPRPSGRRGRISERPQRPELTTLPLQSRPNASPFWIMLLLSVSALEHGMIKRIAVLHHEEMKRRDLAQERG